MLFKKLIRTTWKYKAQFISMIIMVAIGIGMFVGFNMEWYSIVRDTDDFFEKTALSDYIIVDETGFSKDSVEKIKNIEGVDFATRYLNINVAVKEKNNRLALNVAEEYGNVSRFMLISGSDYDKDSENGIWLSDRFAAANDVKVGDELTFTYSTLQLKGVVKGLVKAGEFLVCVPDSNQLMPDFKTYGFAFITPVMLKSAMGREFYTQINVKSDLDKTDMERLVKDAFGKTSLVLSRDENTAYASAQGEVQEGKTMGAILPVMFLLIGILTMVTTMHRVTINEKRQIGTLKALGFRDGKILWHYTSYGLFIGVVGAILGIALGYAVAYIIINPNGTMGTYFDLPSWELFLPWYCWLVVALIVGLLTLISFLSVKKMLKGSAADALRPYTPKKMRKTVFEKTKLWDKLPFGTKWNTRDVLRHKNRSFMTLFGIIGCMILLVDGLGMKDTMDVYMDSLTNEVCNYTTRINVSQTATNENAIEVANKYLGDYVASQSVKLNDKTVSLDIYNVTRDKIRFLNEDNDAVTLGDDGAYVCLRIADRGVKVGDYIEFSPFGSENTYKVKVAGILRSLTSESITITEKCAQNAGIPYKITSIYTDETEIAASDYISGTQSKKVIVDSYSTLMELTNTMVWLFVAAAVLLGTIVLYNLGTMSYVERSRELATLKVVGFRDLHIARLLIGQNMALTILGIIIGLPAGYGLFVVICKYLASEFELKVSFGALTYTVSILLTFVVSLVVGLFIARKNKKIDMVEALKADE